jgi:hypothetical protein
MERIKEYNQEKLEENPNADVRNAIIMDDVMTSLPSSFEKKGSLNKMIIQARHNKTWLIFLVQKYNALSPLIRNNADLISFFKTDNRRELETMINDINHDKDTVKQLYEFSTEEPNSFLHINLLTTPTQFFKKFDRIVLE